MVDLTAVNYKTLARMASAALVMLFAMTTRPPTLAEEAPAEPGRRDAVETDAFKARRAALLINMREMAELFEIVRPAGVDRRDFELLREPIFNGLVPSIISA
jgi:hypothetical protein